MIDNCVMGFGFNALMVDEVFALWLCLQVIIDKFSQVYPDYKERVVAHEAAHLLLGK